MPAAATIEIRRGDERRALTLPPGEIAIGRAPDSDVVLDDSLVSRHHARLAWDGESLVVTDLGSSNGTRVNDREIDPRVPFTLDAGDAVQIGAFALSVALPPPPDETVRPRPIETVVIDRPTIVIAPPTPRLVVTTPGGVVEHPLEGDVLRLGREAGNDIIVDEPVVSRRHAVLHRLGDGYEIEDLGSANGLTLGGAPVTRARLVPGDVLRIADTVSLSYQGAARAPDEPRSIRVLDLAGRANLTIGRDPRSDVALGHPAISRTHARVVAGGAELRVEDAGSTNGTFVNGERVEPGIPRKVEAGDEIRVGPIKLLVTQGALEQTDESRDLQLDAVHLNQPVRRGLNLLQDISLSIRPREFVALVGVSGAGKSTLLDALNGFRPARDGNVLLNGTDLYRNAEACRTAIGYVPQDDIIHRELTVREALDFAARLRLPADTTAPERRRRVDEVLDTLGLVERAGVPIHRLSGGQRKRVSIGAELLTEPGLFFLDEATSGLDPGTEAQLMRLLRSLADKGHTIVLVTHATKNVMLCDQVAFLAKGGHMAYFGPPDRALGYFGVTDFDEIYEKVERELSPADWGARYRQSAEYREFVVARLQERYGALLQLPRSSAGAPQPLPRGRRPSSLRQFWVLSARYLGIIRRDRVNLLLLFLVAPLLGCIDFVAWPRDVFDPVDGDVMRVMSMLFLASVVPFLVGSLSSVREIVKEAPIYRRERAVVLGITPYLLSKVWVGVLFSLYNAAVLLAIKLLAVDMSHLEPSAIAQVYVTLALVAMSGVLWGLLISSLAPREEQAMLLVIVVVVVQIVFSGGLVPLDRLGHVGGAIADVTSTKWTFQGLTTATEVMTGDCDDPALETCQLPGIEAYSTTAERQVLVQSVDDRFGAIFGVAMSTAWTALGAIMAALFALLVLLQRRKDRR